jgi:2-keto-4-pentenoate hydratase/2-oxohepta-3-ene-1,7-dioic acid hydratase in catechol pathway
MPSYMLVTYQSDKGPRAGIAVGDKLFDAAALTRKAGYASVLAILQDWGSAKGVLKKAAAAAGKSKLKSKPLAKAKLLAPVLWPSAIYCAGANYTDHMMEMAKLQNLPPAPRLDTNGRLNFRFGGIVRLTGDTDGEFRGDVRVNVEYF